MRARWMGGLLLGCAAVGCFEAVTDGAGAVADALTRGVRFDGGEIVAGKMPDSQATEVTLIPPNLPSVMSPGQVSLMGFDVDNPDEVDNPTDATLIQFKGARDHIRVVGGGRSGHFEHSFTVDDDVCAELCNKRHAVTMRVAMRMRDKRVSGYEDVPMTLDCVETGNPKRCEGSSGADDTSVYGMACRNSLDVCGGVLQDIGISDDVGECAATYSCVIDFYGAGSECANVVDSFVSCLAGVSNFDGCEECVAPFTTSTSECEEPTPCLADVGNGGSSGGAGGGAGGISIPDPFDAGVGVPVTSELADTCAKLCDAEQRVPDCAQQTPDCARQCENDLGGTVCEKPLLAVYQCALNMPEGAFVCDVDGTPLLNSDACTAEQTEFARCAVANPGLFDGGVSDLLPDAGPPAFPSLDAGLPGF